MSSSLGEVSYWPIAYVIEQHRVWRDCADAQARQTLCCSYMIKRLFSHDTAHINLGKIVNHGIATMYYYIYYMRSIKHIWLSNAFPPVTKASQINPVLRELSSGLIFGLSTGHVNYLTTSPMTKASQRTGSQRTITRAHILDYLPVMWIT